MRNLMDTGYYSYFNADDGLCCYRHKRDAVRNAIKAGASEVWSPTGRTVWTSPVDGEDE